MKVGTDAVLLGSWVRTGAERFILDIGTGSGILALMLAQRSTAYIDAIDVDEGAYRQARENFLISPWFQRLNVEQTSLQAFAESADRRYDLIVSNPPYFNSSKPAEGARTTARHAETLPFPELVAGVRKLLTPRGRCCVILPVKEGMEFMDIAQSRGLFCHRLTRVRTVADKPEKRLLMEFNQTFGLLTEDEIIIQKDDHTYTEEYIDLTREYYIHLKPSPPSAP